MFGWHGTARFKVEYGIFGVLHGYYSSEEAARSAAREASRDGNEYRVISPSGCTLVKYKNGG